jgi:integrase
LVIDIPYRDKTGKKCRFRRDAQVQTVAAAHAEERRLLAQLATTGDLKTGGTGASADGNGYSFDDAVKNFRRGKAVTSLKPSTRIGYDDVIDRVLKPRFEGLRLEQIEMKRVAKLDAELVGAGLTPSTRRNVQVTIRSILRAAIDGGLMAEMPKLPKLPKVGGKVPRTLSESEVAAILEASNQAARLAFALALYAGLRAGEVRGIRWCDIDLHTGTLVVRRAICRGEVAPPKSGHERVVPLAEPLRILLDDAAGRGHGPWDPVAPSSTGKVWSEPGLRAAFRAACTKAKVGKWRFHDTRHAFVSRLFTGGASAPVVQRLAGHRELSTTARYAHVVDDQLRAAIDVFRAWQ